MSRRRIIPIDGPVCERGGWATWFRVFGTEAELAGELALRSPRFTSIGAALAATMEGAGVALGHSLPVHDAIRDGRFVRPLNSSFSMPSSKVHVCCWRPEAAGDEGIAAVVDWLAEASRRTIEDVHSIRRYPSDARTMVLAGD